MCSFGEFVFLLRSTPRVEAYGASHVGSWYFFQSLNDKILKKVWLSNKDALIGAFKCEVCSSLADDDKAGQLMRMQDAWLAESCKMTPAGLTRI